MMSKRTIVAMPGDGIGKSVLPEAIRVLEAVGFEAEYVHGDIGWDFWCSEGNALPQRTVDLLEKHRVGLFGAITSKPKKEADAELAPKLRGTGLSYFSPIVGLRQHFDLQICIRPCQTFPGNPLNYVRRTMHGGYEEPLVNVVVFRQNTQGLYSGVEWTNPPKLVRDALESHPKTKPFRDVPGEQLAVSCRVVSWDACEHLFQQAFEYAKKHGFKSVTVCEKPNVLRETSGMVEQAAKLVAKRFPDIALWSTNIDAQMMWLNKNPEDYGVLVSSNMFGDILSDAFAGLVGGLGFAASANLGRDCAVFEPTHGSAPKYADFPVQIVNPIAMILSACLMLDFLDETARATRIRTAIAAVVEEGHVRSYDMMKMTGRPDVVERGAASTTQMTDAIIAKLG
jgi:3-isopropylmalate dehydrogenase